MNTLLQRYRAQLPYTCSGPDLITLQPQTTTVPSSGKVRWGNGRGQRQVEGPSPGYYRGELTVSTPETLSYAHDGNLGFGKHQ